MRQYKKLILFIAMSGCIISGGCKTENTSGDPVGSLIKQNGCKQFTSRTVLNNTTDNPVVPPGKECISYQYDPGRTLYLQHINGGFNCCPGDIIADITIGDNGITIIEAETSDEKCHCLCLFDLDYEIKNIDPGRFTVTISGSLKQITAEIDLHQAYSGTICVERTEYPWTW